MDITSLAWLQFQIHRIFNKLFNKTVGYTFCLLEESMVMVMVIWSPSMACGQWKHSHEETHSSKAATQEISHCTLHIGTFHIAHRTLHIAHCTLAHFTLYPNKPPLGTSRAHIAHVRILSQLHFAQCTFKQCCHLGNISTHCRWTEVHSVHSTGLNYSAGCVD